VEMNVSVVDLSANQKRLQVEIPALRVREELDEKYRDLAKNIRIKGFRPGKVPRNIIKSYYGKTVESELSSQFVQRTFQDALREANLKPLMEIDVSEMRFEDSGAFTYVVVVDISPPFEIQDYRGLSIHRSPVEIDPTRVDIEIERIRQQHSQLRNLEVQRPAAEGDVVLVDLVPTVDGAVYEQGKASDYMVEIGKEMIHPEFDRHLIGHQSGESVAFDLDYPEDMPAREISGKRVHFEVTMREIKEKFVPELDDEFAKEVGQFENLEELRQTVKDRLLKLETERVSADVRQQIIDQLLSKVEIELSSRVVDREIDRLTGLLRYRLENQGIKIDPSKYNDPEVRAEYRPQAEKNVRWGLICDQIAGMENLVLSEQELEDIYRDLARASRMDVESFKQEYMDSGLVQQAKEGRLQDKVMRLLEEAAVLSESPTLQEDLDQE